MPLDSRAVTLVSVALSSAALAGLGFALVAWLDAFEPCRVAYRLPSTVSGSLACQVRAAITLFSALLASAAALTVVAAGVRFYGSRSAQRGGAK